MSLSIQFTFATGTIKKITYKNTTGKVSSVTTYVTIMENGAVSGEEYYDNED